MLFIRRIIAIFVYIFGISFFMNVSGDLLVRFRFGKEALENAMEPGVLVAFIIMGILSFKAARILWRKKEN